MSRILPTTFTFLTDLSVNNNRDWFEANRARYEAARENVANYAEELLQELSQIDRLETESGKKSLFRIYRDVRFSKNKQPYKIAIAGRFRRDGLYRRGGYYFHIEPGNCLVGGGFYGIERDDLHRMRSEIAVDPEPLRKIIHDPVFVKQFGSMRGEKLKTAPQGYAKDHPAIELLRFKQFYVSRQFTASEAMSDDFVNQSLEAYKAIRPFFDYFSEVLTTDANGELIV